MKSRREFLLHLFKRLESDGIEFVISRNYGEVLDSQTSDVDLLTDRARFAKMISAIRQVASEEGYPLVQVTRFAVYSMTFWNGVDDFLRIDVDISVRWRAFHLLDAGEVLERRRCVEGLWIPSPEHEMVILFSKLLWVGHFSDRYRKQWMQLSEQITDRPALLRLFGKVFGVDRDLTTAHPDGALVDAMRRGLWKRTFSSPSRALESLRYLVDDAARIVRRLLSPPGCSVQIVTTDLEVPEQELTRKLLNLYPLQKGVVVKGRASFVKAALPLFRGGLVIEIFQVADDLALERRLKSPPPAALRANRFIAAWGTDRRLYLTHAQTGAMETGIGAPFPVGQMSSFIARSLARMQEPTSRRGLFAVLVGLDGSGKTTVARGIACSVPMQNRFSGFAYFHWIPQLRETTRFPFPAYSETPRKPELKRNLVNALASSLRLFRNALIARIGFQWHYASRVEKNFLVLADRYFLNYWVDPQSVRYVGPAWLLRSVAPLFPRPDCILVLKAGKDQLLSRKRELNETQIAEQIRNLATLARDFEVIEIDAGRPADEVLSEVLEVLKNRAMP